MHSTTLLFQITRRTLSLILFSGLLSTAIVRADSILSLPAGATGPLPAEMWKTSSKSAVQMKDGVLHITADSQNPAAYNVQFLFNAVPLGKLNFLHNAVEIKIQNLDIQGDASPSNRVFSLFFINDKPLESADTSSLLKIRMGADGMLAASFNPHGGAAQPLWQAKVTLPVKLFTVSLSPTGVKFALEDANGPQSQESPWTDAMQAATWDSATPYLRIQGQRNPGSGSTDVTIGSLSVDSTDAAAPPK